ncbi:MAG: nucleoside kinase [Peptococcaceae bacterium]|nr:nucleoside kinase [Peptococcaceae bacterium]
MTTPSPESHRRQQRQTLQLGLLYVTQTLFPDETLHIPYSIPNGLYCELGTSPISKREVAQIFDRLKTWVYNDSPIDYLGQDNGYYLYRLDSTTLQSVYPALTSSSCIKDFRLIPFRTGFVLYLPSSSNQDILFIPPANLSATYAETRNWLSHLDITQLDSINTYIDKGRFDELVTLAEALHEKKVSAIADAITHHHRTVQVVLVSGPSSAGKTTFTRRLATQLRVNGLKPLSISLDDYFVDREKTPLDATGHYDFDSLGAIDLDLLNDNLNSLISGEEVELPKFNFASGQREPFGHYMRMDPSHVLILEGIHALNPDLLRLPSSKYDIFKIYISALFLLNIDTSNRIATTETRLLRRIVRDDHFRSLPVERTLKQWPSVRHGEDENIFPYQEEADIMFNSSLLFELNILRPYAEPLLKTLTPDSPYYAMAQHLLNLLSFFRPMPPDPVPNTSILREFIGGSVYHY